jgi:hypothetical protein
MKGVGFKPNICLSPDSLVISYLNADLNLVRIKLESSEMDTIDLQFRLKPENFSFSNPRHIADDGTSVWMTGQNGILRYDYVQDKIQGYGVNDGLSHSFTFSVVRDLQQNIWVGSIGGIDKYDRTTDKFVSVYRIKDNTYMDAFGHALCSDEGVLFFHFGNKLIRINPNTANTNLAVPYSIQFDEVLVNGQPVDWQDPSGLNHLKYEENRLTFSYDVLLYNDADPVHFYYRLNGREWINNGNRNEINFDGLAGGKYLLELKAGIGSNPDATPVVSIPFNIHPPFWKQTWFFALLFILLAGGLWFYYKRRIDQYREELKIARQIADLESKALRAQMNPHFVFNSLNAIQECIVTGRVEEAYSYLSKFSKLLRMVLEHSDMTEVTLQEELEVLNLYVSLEKLRFKDDVRYRLQIDDELDPEEIYIPPMLIQPHLENALWHGLKHKEDHKNLVLSIEEKPAGYLVVIIEDNGIGRKKAGELNQARLGGNKHKSKGKQLSSNRMDLLRNNYPLTSMTITDLYDSLGESSGTRVTIIIPMVEKSSGSIINPVS